MSYRYCDIYCYTVAKPGSLTKTPCLKYVPADGLWRCGIKTIHKVNCKKNWHKIKVRDALQNAQRGNGQNTSPARHLTKWRGPRGKRERGRSKARWIDDILQLAGRDWMKTANDRNKWGQLEEVHTRKGPNNDQKYLLAKQSFIYIFLFNVMETKKASYYLVFLFPF